jgi:hypothetical protein
MEGKVANALKESVDSDRRGKVGQGHYNDCGSHGRILSAEDPNETEEQVALVRNRDLEMLEILRLEIRS